MGILGEPWPISHEGWIWSLGMLNGEKVGHGIFPKQRYSVIWKKVLHAPLWMSKVKVIRIEYLSTFSNDFTFETTGLILIKFHMQHLGNRGSKICSNGPGHMTKMALIIIYGLNLKKPSPEPPGLLLWNFIYSIWWLSSTKYLQMQTLGWPWPIFPQGQIWFLGILNGEKVKPCIFPKQC